MNLTNYVNQPTPLCKKTLTLAIAAQFFAAGYSYAGPEGGAVVAGAGDISQNGNTTRIEQSTERLSLEWESFNVAADERVEFLQPGQNATALNRILDHNGSEIMGQIDANGHVILMNPNGILFGESATVDVGGLVATGLNINSDDFMNGDFVFDAIDDSSGAVINRGIINAATGGNAVLLGKTVANHGLISAELGHVALASGSQAFVTFDDQGLIGVRIDEETVANEIDGDAVTNTGALEAKGGKILLNASVSADLFSQAVNRGDMTESTTAVVHDDGSFTLGAGSSVVNTGSVDVSADTAAASGDAGSVIMAGDRVHQRGAVKAHSDSANAGNIYAEATDAVTLGSNSQLVARGANGSDSGKVSLDAANIEAARGAQIDTSGNTLINSTDAATLPEVNSTNLFVQSTGEVTQACSMQVSGNTHLLLANAKATLNDSSNDFNTLSLDARYNTELDISDRNTITLADAMLIGSEASIRADGDSASLTQTQASHIQLSGSALQLEADNLILGEGESTTSVNHSVLELFFSRNIDTNSSITLVDDFAPMPPSARIVGSVYGRDFVIAESGETIDMEATFDDTDAEILSIAGLSAGDLQLRTTMTTTQTGPIKLSGTLHWGSGETRLTHPENDIARLTGSGTIFNVDFNYMDANSVDLGNIILGDENGLHVTSVGDNARLRQEPNTRLVAAYLDLDADTIDLGANGTSSINAFYGMELNFGNRVSVNGSYTMNSYGARFQIQGDDTDNSVYFGEHATSGSLAGGELKQFNVYLGDGDDQLTFANDLNVGGLTDIQLGSGNDVALFGGALHAGANTVTFNLNTGSGDDFLAFADTLAIEANTADVDIALGAGRDTALFSKGLQVSAEPGDTFGFNMGQDNDLLLINDHFDVPITTGDGSDLMVVLGADTSYDLTDKDNSDVVLVVDP